MERQQPDVKGPYAMLLPFDKFAPKLETSRNLGIVRNMYITGSDTHPRYRWLITN
jgi:hypothetical protein